MAYERTFRILKSYNISLLQKHPTLVFPLVLLMFLSFVINFYKLEFSYGILFTFGSFFLLVILRLYGPLIGLIAAVTVNVLSWRLLGLNLLVAFSSLEVAFLGLTLNLKYKNFFLYDIVYWAVIGAPVTTLFYYYYNSSFGTECLLVVLSYSINGFLNVLLADIVISYLPVQRLIGDKSRNSFNFSCMLFHLSIAAVIAPFIIFTFVDGRYLHEKIDSEIIQMINSKSSSIEDQITSWPESDMRKLRLKSPLHLERLNEIIERSSVDSLIEIIMVDNENNIYTTNKNAAKYIGSTYNWKNGGQISQLSKDIYQWLPSNKKFVSDINRWDRAFYIKSITFKGIDLNLLIKTSLANYNQEIWDNYLNKLFIILLCTFVAIIVSLLMNRILSGDLSKLAKTTTGLPDKLKGQESIQWPSSPIFQISSLISNFQVMSNNLLDLFTEAKNVNKKLLDKTYELEKSEEKLKHLAYYDALTSIPNRRYFSDYLEGLLATSDNTNRNIAVMFIDLNRFKHINDTLGHDAGDQLIKEVAKRLSVFLKPGSFVARMGGDEFVIVLDNTDKNKAADTAAYISNLLSEPVTLNPGGETHELSLSGSIGICLYPDDARNMSAILKNADMAMYAAKESGGGKYRFYSELSNTDRAEQMFIEQGINNAHKRNELLLFYQPKMDIKSGDICGLEALVRWNHPQLGMVPPLKFIPIAEETGAIIQIDEWVLLEACKQTKIWQASGYSNIRVSVNLSPKQFHGHDIVKKVREAIEYTNLAPQYLELEVTEGFLIKNMNYAIEVLKQLKDIGVYISIDDFGTGYSSLYRLSQLPIDCLKIDKAFIDNITQEKKAASIVKAIVELAHSMNLSVIAEGVEDKNSLEILRQLNCDEIQGYFLSKPLPINDMENWILMHKLGDLSDQHKMNTLLSLEKIKK